MKGVFVLFSIVLCLSCVDDFSDNQGKSKQLLQITVDGKSSETFEYDGALLVKENVFSFCEKNPSDEFIYSYQDNKLITMYITLRGLYSNSTSVCDPSAGVDFIETFEYNSSGEISRVIRGLSYSEWIYNADGRVEKQILFNGPDSFEANYTYDTNGNLREIIDFNGSKTQYEYDDKINPFYLMKKRPGLITAFNKSPNNVIRARGSNNFERVFEYSNDGFPTRVSEDNGLTFLYTYR